MAKVEFIPPSPDSTQNTADQWVDTYGDILYRMALSRVGNPTAAEDIVQETFVAALKARDRFQHRSSELTWLAGILKHKVIDHLRESYRAQNHVIALDNLAPVERSFDPDQDYHWKIPVHRWPKGPDSQAEANELRETLERCLEGLDEHVRQIFLLREMDDMKTEELCKLFDLTATNLWVTLHRVRHKLRNCMEKNWFKLP